MHYKGILAFPTKKSMGGSVDKLQNDSKWAL